MELEDLVESQLAGEPPTVPPDLREEFDQAMAGHDALQFALGETFVVADATVVDRPPPKLPGDYEIVREVGRGGMGVVYLARQRSLGRNVAVKVLRPGEIAFGPLVKRFMEEARHLARLRHPNIVPVHEIGQAGEEPYFTMDFVDGRSLSAVLAEERLSPTRALAIIKQTAEAVRHAHEQGIIHRDLKPANILIDAAGRVFVTDFGLARDMTQTSKLTHSGQVMGTPAYMSPEQATGQSELIGEATDVHALGVVLYEMLTGRPPYGSDAAAHVLVRLLKEEPVPPRKLDRRIPRDLETICLKAMAKAPEGRYASVAAFLEDIRRFEAGEAVLARRPGPVHHLWRAARRYWKMAAAVTAAVAATAVLAMSLAPALFDKSAEELIAAGDEQHAAGEHAVAVRMYRRAVQKATGSRRYEAIERLVRCCREINDPREAVEAAMLVIEDEPGLSFGEYDYLVAQAVVSRVRSANPNKSLRWVPEKDRPLLKLAQTRLRMFLAGPHGSAAERAEAETTLSVIEKELGKEVIAGVPSPSADELPQGTLQELLALAADENRSRWERGKASHAAGLALEKQENASEALKRHREAFALLTSVYPVYAGLTYGPSDRPGAQEVAECQLVRCVYDAVRRLDSRAPDVLRGGLRLKVEGVTIPADVVVNIDLTLCDPAVANPNFGIMDLLPQRGVPLRADQTAWIGVADGKYRLDVRVGGKSLTGNDDAARRIFRLVELDLDAMPKEVEIRGETVELPPIPARLAAEIKPVHPDEGASVDFNETLFRWTEVPGAAYYRVSFSLVTETEAATPLQVAIASIKADEPVLLLAKVPAEDRDARSIREKLRAGRTAIWHVEAYDDKDRRIGACLELNNSFLVVKGLEP